MRNHINPYDNIMVISHMIININLSHHPRYGHRKGGPAALPFDADAAPRLRCGTGAGAWRARRCGGCTGRSPSASAMRTTGGVGCGGWRCGENHGKTMENLGKMMKIMGKRMANMEMHGDVRFFFWWETMWKLEKWWKIVVLDPFWDGF